MRTHRLQRLILLTVVVASSLGATTAAEVIQVSIGDLAFAPSDIRVRVGDTVEWHNGDFVDHSATAEDGKWDIEIPAGASAKLVMREPGVFTYICRYHPNMTGSVEVTN